MAGTEVVFKCLKEAVRCFLFKQLPASGFPKAVGFVLVLSVLFHSVVEFSTHSAKFKHSTAERE